MRTRLSVAALPLLAGCYSYAPAQPGALQPGSGVRARVSATAAERIAPLLGTENPRVLTGTLVESSNGMLLVEVPTAVQAGIGGSAQSLSQRISLAPADIVELESRRLDRQKTAIVVAGGAVIAGLAIAPLLRNSPGTDHAPGGSSTESKIFVFRFSF